MATSGHVPFESVPGFQLAAVKAGIKASGKPGLGLVVAAGAVPAAGVFTTSRVVAAPVTLCRRHLESTRGQARAIRVNAGCANACTGKQGMANARATARTAARLVGSRPAEVLVCSTGVIGHQLPMERMQDGIEAAHARLGRIRAGAFARAIMTTDLVPKAAGVRLRGLGGARLAGVCKGSGMIAPNMATMLAFLLTDAPVAPRVLQAALRAVADATFNCVTVDSDTSTNDTLLVLANGGAGGRTIARATGKRYSLFLAGLEAVCLSLAEQIAADGEGATKLVRVRVRGARTTADARRAARTIAESPLVKTALFGNDPNWGRVIAALGRSGAAMREARTTLTLCGLTMFRSGTPCAFDAKALSRRMKAKEIELEVELGLGAAACTMLTCDFSYDYVRINAEYHT